ncbi:MAG: hypothetical protein AMJ60_01400 [Desulfobacterales bacterium SG8_35]|nr:MAG: hypothetical protein AMJ60_01400 [Desulfobacterales bacterium SG8_35]
MDAVSLIPAPDALQVHWFWLHLLLTFTTFLHFVAMNIMLGAGLIAFSSPFWRGSDVLPLNAHIAKSLPYTIAFTINLGVAPLLFLQVLYGQFLYTSSILMAVYWLSIVGLLIVSYYAAYVYRLIDIKGGMDRLYIGAAVLLLLCVSFLFSNNVSIMQMPEIWTRYFSDRTGWLLNFSDPALIPRYLHFIASAAAIGGLAIALYFEIRKRRGATDGDEWIKLGCKWFTVATIINFGFGFWFLGALPETAYNPGTLGGKIFFIFIIGSVATIIPSVAAAQTGRIIPATVWALVTVLLMTLARDILRLTYLKPYFNLSELPYVPQYSPFIIFLLAFVGGGFIVGWMLRTVWNAKEVA